jgi:DNA-binding CsgD family transcriptional regulator
MSTGSGRRGKGPVRPANAKFSGFPGKSLAKRSIPDVWDCTFDDTADMVLLIDGDFAIIKANGAFARTSGREPGDLIGRKCYEIVRGTTEPPPVSPDGDAPAMADAVVEVFYVARIGNHFLLSVPRASADPDRFLRCIRVATEISMPEMTEKGPRIGDGWEPGRDEGQDRLTPRQHEILRLLCQGLLVKEIAFRLKISARTVEFHKRKMMENIGVRTFAELIKYAIRQHIAT